MHNKLAVTGGSRRFFKGKLCLAGLLMLLFWHLLPIQGLAADGGRQVVRVGYPIQLGMTEVDEQGNYSGYTYEYLEEIAQYTGWDYEFVQVEGDLNESLVTLMDMLEKGEIDLMGGMLYSREMEQLYDYSSNSYGIVYTVFQVLYDDTDYVNDSQVEKTLRVAMYGQSRKHKEEMEDYCRMNLQIPQIVPCTTIEEHLRALQEGRADVMLNTSMNYIEGLRTVARFAPKPFYFVTSKGKGGLLTKLDEALHSIEQTDPYFMTTLHEKYFNPSNKELKLTAQEKEYVENTEPLRAGVLTDLPPYSYQDKESGELKGISVDLLRAIEDKTGLVFELVPVENEEALAEMTAEGRVDLIGSMSYDYEQARHRNMAMSRPYISTQYMILLNNKMRNEEITGRKLAILASYDYQGEFVGSPVYYDSREEIVRAINSGEADYTYMDAYVAQYFYNRSEFENLYVAPQMLQENRTCIGVSKPASPELLNIINKVIITMPEKELQSIIYSNTIYRSDITLLEMVRRHPLQAVAVAAAVLLVVIGVLSWGVVTREKLNRKISLELKKHQELYGLVNDYFFEYDLKKELFTVSGKKEGEKHENNVVYRLFPERMADAPENGKYREILRRIMHSGRDGVEEIQLPGINRELHWMRIAMKNIYDHKGAPVCVIGRISDINEEKQERDRLKNQAERDSLTHVYNAKTSVRLIQERLDQLADGGTGALILVDIDKFKTINDTYGHMEGDHILCEVAGILQDSFREGDIVGRPGGDEFIIYMERIRDTRTLGDKCERLLQRISEIRMPDKKSLTISLGAVLARPQNDYDSLYIKADKALYRAKKEGRNTYFIA